MSNDPDLSPPILAMGGHQEDAAPSQTGIQAPESTKRERPDPWAHRRGEPRTFAAGWIVLLFVAAVVSIGGAGATGLVSIDVYRAGARIMLCLIGAAVGLLWPMVRLSQEAPARPRVSMFQDIFVIAAPIQAMTWPQCLPWMAAFPLPPVAALSVNLLAWTILIAGVLAIMLERLRTHPATSRAGLMLIFAGLCLVGPCVGMLLRRPTLTPDQRVDVWQLSSPMTSAWEIVRDRSWTGFATAVAPEHWIAGAVIGAFAVFVWGLALASSHRPA